jgi:hypothetical protein
MDQRHHHLCHLVLDSTAHLVIWYSTKENGFIVGQNHKLLCFDDSEDARQFAKSQGLVFSTKAPTVYDFDRLAQWLTQSNLAQINCHEFVNTWNFFIDLAASTNTTATLGDTGPELNTIYEKLFLGCNLPAVTPGGKRYDPVWSAEETRSLSKLFSNGLHLLRIALP